MKTFNNRDWSNKTHSNFVLEGKEEAQVFPLNVDNRMYIVPVSIYDTDLYGNGDNGLLIHSSTGDLLLFNYNFNQIKPPIDDISIKDADGNMTWTIRDVLLDDTDDYSVATVGYVKAFLNKNSWVWFEDCITKTSTVPDSPTEGQRYLIVGSPPGGAWEGHLNDIAEWDGTKWTFETPVIDNAVRTTDDMHVYLWAELNSLEQWVDLGAGVFSYSAGYGIDISSTTISFDVKDYGGLAVDNNGAYIDYVSPFYVDSNHKFNFKYSGDHFAVGTYDGESGVFLPLQLATATAPLVATYSQDTHLTDISVSYESPLYINSGKLALRINPLGGIENDGNAGIQLNLRDGGGILIDQANGEAYVDQSLTGLSDVEEFSFTTTDDHIYELTGFTSSANASFTLFYKIGTGETAYWMPTEFDFRVYSVGSNILNVLVPYDASMVGFTFRIVAKA